ncbi:MAG: ureidoglycolate lyase [Paracoccus sp. (in: a-proteobacteria)]|nr:ureidoglycolate lyase [Paracoccus sp. (in: a-proteobacteria)]
MSGPVVTALPLSAQAFAPFGDVLEISGQPDQIINQGLCGRFHDRAAMDFGGGRAGISLFHARLCSLPHRLDLLERHPLGSQAFIPMSASRFLVVVAPDDAGRPGAPLAFIARAGQGVNLHRGVWHAVLCPLDGTGIYAVIDRIGGGNNLEEQRIDPPVTICGP